MEKKSKRISYVDDEALEKWHSTKSDLFVSQVSAVILGYIAWGSPFDIGLFKGIVGLIAFSFVALSVLEASKIIYENFVKNKNKKVTAYIYRYGLLAVLCLLFEIGYCR